MIPIGIATAHVKSSEKVVSNSVSSRRSPISSLLGRFHSSDTPRSPCSIRPIQVKYCSTIGRSRPYLVRSASICA